ncbi:MAG: sulfatase [Planctomycetota bacterium]
MSRITTVLFSLLSLFSASMIVNAGEEMNLVVIFIDDLGYRDIGAFGCDRYPTPSLDRMANEGMRFTDFVTSTAVCSASRAALLTGCYHRRVGISGALGPNARHGLHNREVTLAEIAKQKNYATACFGKWHLGHHQPFLPLQHGFDEYFGLPYSNDMWPFHPDYVDFPEATAKRKKGYPDLPLIEGNEIADPIVTGDDQKQLTTRYTERAVEFINKNHERNFFLYVPHSMVHVPLFVSEKFAGKSGVGLFGDVMMEVDWSVGEILKALESHSIQEKTLVIFTSDNGPWLNYGDHAGSAWPLREGKGTMWEGGYRVPTIFWWPGTIQAGSQCDELASTIDILPTFAKQIGANLPNHEIDGKDIMPLLKSSPDARSPHEEFYLYHAGGELQGVRDRQWKLVFPHRYRTLLGRNGGSGGKPVKYDHVKSELSLYDLKNDVAESKNVILEYPDEASRLQIAAQRARDTLGDKLTKTQGTKIRQAMRLPNPEKPKRGASDVDSNP